MTVNKVPATELLLAENPAYPAPVQKMSALELIFAEYIPPAPTNDLWVWNGTTEVPANVTVWNGTSEVEAGVSVT